MVSAPPNRVKPAAPRGAADPFIVVALGSNLGDRPAHLARARAGLARGGFVPELISSIGEYAAVGGPAGQGAYLNQCLAARCAAVTLLPEQLLELALSLERQAGRTRRVRWEARPLDIDLILWGQDRYSSATLELPHPRFRQRRFVLEPLAAILPELVDPISGKAIRELLAQLD